MYRSTIVIDSQYEYGCKKFLANSTMSANQSEVGVITKSQDGFVVFMLDYLTFAIEQDIQSSTVDAALDYVIKN